MVKFATVATDLLLPHTPASFMYVYEERRHYDPVDLRPLEIVGDVSNAALQYLSQGMDAMEE